MTSVFQLTITQDLIDEFETGYPFLEQVTLVNNSVNEIIRTRTRYQGHRILNRSPNEAVLDGFRSESLDLITLPQVTLESGTYVQIPSRYARRLNEISVYSQNIYRAGYAINSNDGPSDARYGVMPQAELEARMTAQRARQDRDWSRNGDLPQDSSSTSTGFGWNQQVLSMVPTGHGITSGHRANQQPNTSRPRQAASSLLISLGGG